MTPQEKWRYNNNLKTFVDMKSAPKRDVLREQIDACLDLLKPSDKKQVESFFGANKMLIAKDAYVNGLAQTGLFTSDPANASDFPPTPQLTWDFVRINRIYRSQPLVSKITTAYSYEQLKSGIDIQSTKLKSDEEIFLETQIDRYSNNLCDAANWGYVYGLGASLIMIDGEMNDDQLREPLDITKIKKGKFLGLKNVVRWQGIMPKGDKLVNFDEINERNCKPEELGEPLYFEIKLEGDSTFIVHRSRLLIFTGKHLAGVEKQVEMGCGVSIIESIYLPLINYLSVINYVTKMLQISQERVLSSNAFDESALLSEAGQAAYAEKMNNIANGANTNSFICIGEDDTFDYKGANFANIDKVVQCSQEDLSAAATMPLNKLFGKSPTGMNSSSKENLTDFYDFIDRERNGDMKSNLYKLLPVIYASEYGKEMPSDVTFKFRSLWVPDEEEKALIIDRKMRPIEKAWENDTITLKEYYLEAQRIGKMTDSFAFINEDTFRELEKSNLSGCRYSDFQRGLIVDGKWVANGKELIKIIKNDLSKPKNSAIVEKEGEENDDK